MRLLILISLCMFSTTYCFSQTMTMEELKEAKWDTLTESIYYISLTDKKVNSNDSIQLSVKGTIMPGVTMFFDNYDEVNPTIDSLLIPILKEKITKSKKGYIKLNVTKFMQPTVLTAAIILKDTYDSTNLKKDISFIKKIDGVINVNYISKEMAKEKFLSDGNEDWDRVLTENPLPRSIDVNLDTKKISEEMYVEFKKSILGSINSVADIHFPAAILKEIGDTYYIIEYNHH